MTVAPLDRSLRLSAKWRPNKAQFGATWAFICGAAAALPWSQVASFGAMTFLSRLLVGWFLLVPLWGSLWSRGIAASDARSAAADEHLDAHRGVETGQGSTSIDRSELRMARVQRPMDTLIDRPEGMAAMVFTFCLAWLLDPVLALTLFALSISGWLMSVWLGPALNHGIVRPVNDVFLPALGAWLLLDGAQATPLVERSLRLPASLFITWLQLNWPSLVVFGAFTVIFALMSQSHMPAQAVLRRPLLAAASLVAILVLIQVQAVLAAGVLALLTVVQWPYQSALDKGRLAWYFSATQGLAMLGMLVATLGLAWVQLF